MMAPLNSDSSGVGNAATRLASLPVPKKSTVSRENAQQSNNKQPDDFSAHMAAHDADRKASTSADTTSTQAASDADKKPVDDKSDADDKDSDQSATDDSNPQGLGLVSVLLQTILSMPPRSDRTAANDANITAQTDALAATGSGSTSATTPADAALAALKADLARTTETAISPGKTAADATAQTGAVVVKDSAATHDTVPDELLALLNQTAGAVAGTDRAAAVAAPTAPSQPPAHGELAEPLAERIVWMTDTARAQGGTGTQEARISLHPAELGSLQIRVEMSHDGSTKVSFDVQTPQARQAIEASLPQLRDLLSPNAVNAASTTFELSGGLSQQQQSRQSSAQTFSASSASSSVTDDSSGSEVSMRPTMRALVGLLDQFA
jgi:flagellar hook-length control protein FliK